MVRKKAVKIERPDADELAPGEKKYVARTKLLLNKGRLAVTPGMVIILGPKDRDQGVHIDNLVKHGNVVEYESPEQAEEIRKWWETEEKTRRQSIQPKRRR